MAEHIEDIRRIAADFHDAFERTQTSSTQSYGVNKYFSSQSPAQRRLSDYNWKPGPRRGTEDAIGKQIAGGTGISLQEASDYVDHAILHERFYVTHFAGCRGSLQQGHFLLQRPASSPSTSTTPGESCTIRLSKAILAGFYKVLCHVLPFGVLQPVAQTVFTVLSLHINNVYAKKRGIAKKIIQAVRSLMISQDIDLVAGAFNGAAWRCRSRDNLRSIGEAFADCALRTPPGPPPLWGSGSIPNNWGGRLWFS